MKKISLIVVLIIIVMGTTFVACDSPKTVNLKTEIDSISYLHGAFMGYQFREGYKQNPEPPINIDAVVAGFINGGKRDSIHLGMDIQEVSAYIQNYFQAYQIRLEEKNTEESNNFLAENRGKSGVITTESGLQYKVTTEGTGVKPKESDVVKIHYHGNFLDGSIFDSSVQRGEPADLPIAQMGYPGLKEGLLLMPVGSKYTFWIPQELGPGKLLIIEIESFEIVNP